MRILLLAVLTGACTLGLPRRSATASPQTPTAPPPWCLPTTDAGAIKLRQMLVELGSSSEKRWPTVRSSNGIPVTAASDIHLISDETVCEQLSHAFDATPRAGAPQQAPVYAARFGALLVAYPPAFAAGEWGIVAFYDSNYNFVAALAW